MSKILVMVILFASVMVVSIKIFHWVRQGSLDSEAPGGSLGEPIRFRCFYFFGIPSVISVRARITNSGLLDTNLEILTLKTFPFTEDKK